MNRQSVAVVADMHIDAMRDAERNAKAVEFIKYCRGKFDRLILLGDTFDFYFSYGDYIPRNFGDFIHELRVFAEEGSVIICRGNHDYWLGEEIKGGSKNIDICDDYLISEFFGREYLMMHGDRPGKLHTKEKLRDSVLHSPVSIKLFSLLPKWAAYRLGRYISLFTENGLSAFHHSKIMERRIRTHEAWTPDRTVITGHIHNPYRSADSKTIITGDFKKRSVYLVIDEQGEHFEYF